MKHRYLFLFIIGFSLSFNSTSFGQMVGTDVFLQGHWLEIGVDNMGAFGTCSSPAGYHAHGSSSTFPTNVCYTTGNELDACYDWGHDGWDAGVPCEMGDYTIPGYPQEGWSLQAAGIEYDNWAGGGTCSGPFDVPGSITGYSNSGGVITGTFTGAVAGLNVIQESRVDTEASWVVVTTRIYNTTPFPIPNVYYERTCDPDNTSFWPGGSSVTENVIVHQNEDARHEVMVGSYGTSTGTSGGVTYTYDRYDSWLSLATKDCRAKCMVITSLFPTDSLSTMWSSNGGAGGVSLNTLPDSINSDQGIALVYNIGTIAAAGSPGDSAIVSYAYIYSGPDGIDSAFPDPQISANNVVAPNSIEPLPTYDTFVSCANPGVLSLPVHILHATDKNWSWSTWTWSPSTGLSATTGVNNTVNITALSGPTTYTITGTDSAANMQSCNNRVFYLTVFPCFNVTSNSPGAPGNTICVSDTLKLAGHGDSTGATYFWYGPGGYTSTGQFTFRTGLTMADTGLYYGVKTVAGSHDTATTRVFLKPLPVVTPASNSPICSGGGNTLALTATPGSSGETFSWTGPNGFSSGTQNPTATGLPVSGSGTYEVITTLNGCTDSGFVSVTIDSTPAVPVASSNSPGPPGPTLCERDTLHLTVTDATAGVTYAWAGPDAFTSTEQNPVINTVSTTVSGSYTVTATLGMCSISSVIPVGITPEPPLTATNNGPVCTGIEDTLLLQATSEPGATYSWTGPYTFFSLNQNPFRTPVGFEYAGVYQVTAFLDGCSSVTVNDTVIVRQTPAPPVVAWLTYCQLYPASPVQAMGDSILWYPTDTAHGIGSVVAPIPSTTDVGVSWYYASQTMQSCTSYLDSVKVTVNPKPTVTVSNDTAICPHDTLTLTATDTDPLAYYHWFPSIYLTDTASASIVARPETNVHYTVVASNQFGCSDTARVAVSVQPAAVLNLGDSVTLYPGESYQLDPQTNCTSFTWFPASGLDNAHISSPLASPGISTIYTVRGETSWGCVTDASISIYVNSDASIAMPNAFSPGNGPNGEFKIIKRGLVTLKYFRVFDRWGVKVFETTDIDKGWDGTFNGTPQPFGVYIYELGGVTNTGVDFEKHGNITLIR